MICCGVWSPKVAALAGARLALTPIVHQMISVGPIGLFAGTTGEISYPIVRDVDEGMYERQHGGDMEVGSYMHRPIIVPPETIPSNEEAVLSPTELPFTADDFDPQLAASLELMPELLGDEKAGIRYAINGLISMTPDGHPLLGETPEVKGLWTAAASWIKEGPGCGRAVAELMSGKVPTVDVHEADVARFYPSSRTTGFARARAAESFNKMYGIVHPAEQYESLRPLRTGPLYEPDHGARRGLLRDRPLGAAALVRVQRAAADEVRRPADGAARRVGVPLVVADHQRRAPGDARRRRAGRPVRVHHPRRHRPRRAGRPAEHRGRAARRAGRPDRLHVVPQRGGRLRRRPDDHAARREPASGWSPARPTAGGTPSGSATGCRATPARRRQLGLVHDRAVGTPRRRRPRRGERDGDQSPPRSFGMFGSFELGGAVVLGSRISYVGEFGWELHVPADQAGHLWDLLRAAGQPHGLVPVGIGVYGTTARLEKGYRAFGAELTAEYNLVEAGMARPRVKAESFIGKDAYLAPRAAAPAAVLCTLTVDSLASADGTPRYMLGGEPILTLDGSRLVDAHGRPSYVTSAGSGPSVGTHLLMAYLPPELSAVGTPLLVEYMGEQYPVTVASHGAVFDPSGSRMR